MFVRIDKFIYKSLWLPSPRTHTHAHIIRSHTYTFAHTFTHSHTITHSLIILSLTITHEITRSVALTHGLTLSHAHSYTHTHTLYIWMTHPLPHLLWMTPHSHRMTHIHLTLEWPMTDTQKHHTNIHTRAHTYIHPHKTQTFTRTNTHIKKLCFSSKRSNTDNLKIN